MGMELAELGFDDEDILSEPSTQQTGEPDDDIKKWMDGDTPDGDTYSSQDDNNQSEPDLNDDDLIVSILKAKGINPEAVKFQSETGDIEEVAFSSLSKEEQLELLNYSPADEDYGLEQEEVELINQLRENNLSVQDYLEAHRQQAIQDYMDSLDETPQYQIDDMSDDELFIADLKVNVPEITEEEAIAQLDLEKQNESLFNKKMNGLRTNYKQREDIAVQQAQEELTAQQAEAAAAFEADIVDAIQATETIDLGDSKLSLSEDDMNEIASFILDTDAAGVRHLAKAINDPQMLVQMAWFALKGPDALSQISEYYKHQIAEQSRNNYNKGYSDAKAGKTSNPTKTVIRKPGNTPTSHQPSINDLD